MATAYATVSSCTHKKQLESETKKKPTVTYHLAGKPAAVTKVKSAIPHPFNGGNNKHIVLGKKKL